MTTTSTTTTTTSAPATLLDSSEIALIALAVLATLLLLLFLLRRRSTTRVETIAPQVNVAPLATPEAASTIVAAPQIATETVVIQEPETIAPDVPDDFTRMKGVGPKLAAQLGALGYTRFAQIAALTPNEAETLDAQLGAFRGRLARDRWIEQACYLANADTAGFESAFGRL